MYDTISKIKITGKKLIRDDIYKTIVSDDYDGESVDVIIQIGIFGEIIYG